MSTNNQNNNKINNNEIASGKNIDMSSMIKDSIILNSSFESVETDNDLTNYDLEYTHYEPAPKRRCSNNNIKSQQTKTNSPLVQPPDKNRKPFKDLQTNKNAVNSVGKNRPKESIPMKISKRKQSVYEDDNLILHQRSDDSSVDDKISPPVNKVAKKCNKKTENILSLPPSSKMTKKSAQQRKQNKPQKNKKTTENVVFSKYRFYQYIVKYFEKADAVFTVTAINALYEASDLYLNHLFEDVSQFCLYQKRDILYPKDIKLILALRKNFKNDNLKKIN